MEWLIIICIGIAVCVIAEEVIFWQTHKRPLTDEEMHKLSDARRIAYINQHFKFTHEFRGVNPEYRASLSREGRWDKIDVPLGDIISLLAQLLRYKRHEWSVWCLTDDSKAKLLWANKGDDNMSCYFKGYIAPEFVFSNGCQTIIHIHNHPQTATFHAALAPSDTDKQTLKAQSEKWSQCGINFIDAVCTRGAFVIFGYSFSPGYCPSGCSIEDVRCQNGISEKQNYKLHKELRKIRRVSITPLK